MAPEAVRSLRQVVHDIAAKEGLQGLFKGAMPSLLKAAPSAAVTFAAYDFFMHWLPLALSRQEGARCTERVRAAVSLCTPLFQLSTVPCYCHCISVPAYCCLLHLFSALLLGGLRRFLSACACKAQLFLSLWLLRKLIHQLF